jgi:hypothetical protein
MNRGSSLRSKVWDWLRVYPFTTLGGVVLLIAAIPFCRRHDSEWEQVYVHAAAHLWHDEAMYPKGDSYLYPPFMALTALPFLALPALPARLLWFAINALCLIALFHWSWRTAGGGRLEGTARASGRERLAALLGGICGISYLENCLAHQQTDVVLAALLAGGCLMLVRGRPLWSATAFGLAAACKCTALLWLPYFLWRRRPLAAVWVLAVAVGVNLLPNLVAAPPSGKLWVQEYISRFLSPLTASHHYVGTWGSDPIYNQSLAGLAHRWCTTAWTWSANDCTVGPHAPFLDSQTFRVGIYSAEFALLSIILWVCGRPFRSIIESGNEDRQALECGMVLVLMLLLSPMSSKAHFGMVVLPGCCLARMALRSRGKILTAIVAAVVILGLICNKDPLGERLYTLSLWYGVVTWQALLLLTGCLFAYRQLQGRAAAQPPCPALHDDSATRAA